MSGYTEQYLVYANGGASHYTSTLDNYTEQECADVCTYELTCDSFEWRDPEAATGLTGNCKTSEFTESEGPGLENSGSELWNFYEADAVVCPDYPDVDGAELAVTTYAKAGRVVVSCDSGYLGGGVSHCQGDGKHNQRYTCTGTTSAEVLTATDCSWRNEAEDGPGTFELGNIDSTPTYWLEQRWMYGYCWDGSVSSIATSTVDRTACQVLCDGDNDCTGATHDGTDCTYYSGDGELTACGSGFYGYQQTSSSAEAIGSTEFAHCGDRSLVLSTVSVTASYEWVFVGCFEGLWLFSLVFIDGTAEDRVQASAWVRTPIVDVVARVVSVS